MDLSTKRHSLAHIMAQAVKQNFPDAKIATGPDTEDGFYYDFDFFSLLNNDVPFRKLKPIRNEKVPRRTNRAALISFVGFKFNLFYSKIIIISSFKL